MFSCLCKKNTQGKSIILYYDDNNELNIPYDDERIIINNIKKTKVHTLELLDYSIKNIETKLSTIKKNINELNKILEGTKNKVFKQIREEIAADYNCPICVTNTKNIVLVPCGHMLCDSCIGNSDYCYFCRSFIEKQVIIFQ